MADSSIRSESDRNRRRESECVATLLRMVIITEHSVVIIDNPHFENLHPLGGAWLASHGNSHVDPSPGMSRPSGHRHPVIHALQGQRCNGDSDGTGTGSRDAVCDTSSARPRSRIQEHDWPARIRLAAGGRSHPSLTRPISDCVMLCLCIVHRAAGPPPPRHTRSCMQGTNWEGITWARLTEV